MITFDFIEQITGYVDPVREGEPLFRFRVQAPVNRHLAAPLFQGKVLNHVARVTNKIRGADTNVVTEYDVSEAGELEVFSFLKFDRLRSFRLGVYIQERGILILEKKPEAFPWVVNDEYIEFNDDGTRSFFCPYEESHPSLPVGRTVWERLGDDF